MLFQTFEFAIFLPAVFFVYWFFLNKKTSFQNVWIVLASYIFYGWWDWRFLSLIFLSSLLDFFIGKKIFKTEDRSKRKRFLLLSIVFNLGILLYFKYCDFFLDNFVSTFRLFGYSMSISGLDIVLPVGISFYTFQTMSYVIDVYRGNLRPTTNMISFFAFVSFFPQLAAGPIERATRLLPQFEKRRVFNINEAENGLRQILWGLGKKILIADQCSILVDQIFENYTTYPYYVLIFGVFLFSLQIYGDFSGYSDIARGVARLFSFNLIVNFKTPYFSSNIMEFWKRWHISLSSWFRDYLYISLGGNRLGRNKTMLNIFIVFLVSGFWHGASWKFIFWGALHGGCFLILFTISNLSLYQRVSAKFHIFFKILLTYSFVSFAWIFFRAPDVYTAWDFVLKIFQFSEGSNFLSFNKIYFILIFVFPFLGIEWVNKEKEFPFDNFNKSLGRVARNSLYYFLILLILFFKKNDTPFIYFQF
ncbi:MAG: membrane-bound O-acyltransferase family protein [Halobacteriovoraceae bacterium]|nr:membrane-bound O-acyltransferase family protein [Halobacteriovoraceae bacterium]